MTVEHYAEWRRLSRAYGRALIALAPLVALYWVVPAEGDLGNLRDTINKAAPLYFMIVLIILASKVLSASSQLIWTGALWFPVQSAIFFGFGPLIHVFGNETTRYYISRSPFYADTNDLFRANMLSTTAITLVLLGFWLHIKLRRGAWHNTRASRLAAIPALQLALAMIIIAGTLKYLIILPSQWSGNPTIFGGSLVRIVALTDVGFGILAYLSAKGDRTARVVFWSLWPFQLLLCTLSFAKVDIVWAMILPVISSFVARRSRRWLIVGLAVTASAYFLAQPYVHYGRSIVTAETGSIDQAGYERRMEILGAYLLEANQVSVAQSGAEDDQQGWWARLSYVSVQAHAIRLYDSGIANPSINQAWMFFIPRLIWPEKPNMSLVGVDFYRLVTGNADGQSSLGISYYGDLYWQYGWWGIFIGAPTIGLLFASMAARSFCSIKRREFLMMPAILIALELSLLGPTGFVLTGALGGSVIYFGYLILLRVLEKALPRVRTSTPFSEL